MVLIGEIKMHDIRKQINIIWEALHSYREDCIPESDPSYNEEWEDICLAMAVIQEQLGEEEEIDL
jgi:hypothetical protein